MTAIDFVAISIPVVFVITGAVYLYYRDRMIDRLIDLCGSIIDEHDQQKKALGELERTVESLRTSTNSYRDRTKATTDGLDKCLGVIHRRQNFLLRDSASITSRLNQIETAFSAFADAFSEQSEHLRQKRINGGDQ